MCEARGFGRVQGRDLHTKFVGAKFDCIIGEIKS